MDAISFFAAYARLGDLTPERKWNEGTCASCLRSIEVTVVGGSVVCRACVPLRQGYPAMGKSGMKKQILGRGRFALISEVKAIYWANQPLDKMFGVEVRLAKKNQANLLREIIETPPDGPYLFIVFAPANYARNFVLNTSRDFLQISNIPLTTLGAVPVRGANRRVLLDLVARYPGIPWTVWTKLIRQKLNLHKASVSAEAQKICDQIERKYPQLKQVIGLPRFNSPEHLFLKVLTDV